MQARIVFEGRARRAVLESGESFSVDPQSLPVSLAAGGEGELVFVPLGEAASDVQARELLNHLLRIS